MMLNRKNNPGLALGLGLMLSVTGCSSTESETDRAEATAVVPGGTPIVVALSAPVSSGELLAGSELYATVDEAILVGAEPVIHPGQRAVLSVVEARAAQGEEPALLTLELRGIDRGETPMKVETHPLELVGEAASMSDAEKVAAGTVGGAVVGGIVEGGEGAVVGGVLGTMAGAVIAINTQGDAVVLPAGQKLQFFTTGEIEIRSNG